jgi:peptide/nickel transport system substrate-binding protein
VAALALVAAACSSDDGDDGDDGTSSTAGEASQEIEELIWALPEVPEGLFVPFEWTTFEGAIMALAQEGLLAFDDDLTLTEAVASSWEQTDPTTYVYTLRDGVKFHDGSDVTPEDVVASMAWHLDEQVGSQLGVFYASVDTIEVTGDREVTVTLFEPDATWQFTPGHMAGFIFKESQLADVDTLGSPDNLPIGTGPYKVVEFVPQDRVVLERFDDYWGAAGPAQRIVITGIPDAQTRLLAMRDGEIDGTFDVPLSEVDQWEALENTDVITAPSLGIDLFTMDYETPPFDDIHVRRAIAHSLDQEGLVAAALQGNGDAAVTVNPPGMWAGVSSEGDVNSFYGTLPQYEFDLEKAAAELAQSSVPDGFEFTLQVPDLPNLLNSALVLSESLAQIGITMKVEQVDFGTWLDGYFGHEEGLGMQAMEWFPDFADPVNYPVLFLHSSQAIVDGVNASNYKNDRVDELIDLALTESDPAAREAALQEMFQITRDEIAVLNIVWPDSAMAISSDLRLDGYNAFWYNIPWAIRGLGTK